MKTRILSSPADPCQVPATPTGEDHQENCRSTGDLDGSRSSSLANELLLEKAKTKSINAEEHE